MELSRVRFLTGKFFVEGIPSAVEVCNLGHICDTYFVTCVSKKHSKRYVLQRINKNVFREPAALMQNISAVSDHIRKKVLAEGGDPERNCQNVIHAKDGKLFFCDEEGEYWRMYNFIEHTVNRQACESAEDFYRASYAFGVFQRRLGDFDASCLYEVIPNFHNTESRLADFEKAVEENRAGRRDTVQAEIDFVRARIDYGTKITSRLHSVELPLRVTHNDTKLNNVMLDPDTGEGVCVIDLDTVMPGSSLYDFGDSIRFGATSAAEDETDLSRVYFRKDYFEACRNGFVAGCGDILTEAEKESLPDGALVITFETGVRFLTDYLNGDTYVKIAYPQHNLDRARNQFRLVADLEEKLESGEIS